MSPKFTQCPKTELLGVNLQRCNLRHLCNERLLSSQGLICIWFSKECWLIPVLGLLWGALALLSGVMELLSGLLCLPWAVPQMRHWNVDAMRFRHCVHQRV